MHTAINTNDMLHFITRNLRYALLITMLALCSMVFAQKGALCFSLIDPLTQQHLTSPEITLIWDGKDTLAYAKKDAATLSLGQKGALLYEFPFKIGQYTLIIKNDGYKDIVKNFKITTRRNSMSFLGEIFAEKSLRHYHLNEAVVKTTRIKMVMHGDTVVFDAGAFELAEGSMLNALVMQLPGTTLKNGEIRVRGKLIESLIVNGEDFFKGNPKVALENLPAYTVKNIKVYDRTEGADYLNTKATGGKRLPQAEEHLVMDVRLRREYSMGLLTNIQAGYGLPNDRYDVKGFSLFNRGNLRLTIYENFNNISNTQTAGSQNGTWEGGGNGEIEEEAHMGGIDYVYKKGIDKITGYCHLIGVRSFEEKKVSQVLFFDGGNVFNRALTQTNEQERRFATGHYWERFAPLNYSTLFIYFDHWKKNNEHFNRRASFGELPQEDYRLQALDAAFSQHLAPLRYANLLQQRYQQEQQQEPNMTLAKFRAFTSFHFPQLGDNIELNLQGDYKRNHELSWMNTHRAYYLLSATDKKGENRLQRHDNASHVYHLEGSVLYNFRVKPYNPEHTPYFQLTPSLQYKRTFNNKDNNLWLASYQLDNNSWNTIIPPSITAPEMLQRDFNNSYYSKTRGTN